MNVIGRRLFGFFAAALLAGCSASSPFTDDIVRDGRGYVDTASGQVHFYREVPEASGETQPPIVFFHPSPRSGLLYERLLEEMGTDRVAIAFDTPGFGGSDPLTGEPTMSDFARVMAEALEGLGYGEPGLGKVDVFGFHTGSLIATELAISRPDMVGRVVLSGIPLRSSEDRTMLLEGLSRNAEMNRDSIEYVWLSNVENREEGVSFDEATRSFAENIRALTGDYWHAYYAVWAYPIEERLAELENPLLVLNYPYDTEFGSTREAHSTYFPDADYVELSEISDVYHPFTPKADVWASALRTWLDDEAGS